MISAIHTALSGLNAAGRKFESAAIDVVQGGAQTVSSAPSAGQAATGGATGSLSRGPAVPGLVAASTEGPSLAQSMFAVKEAEILYKANAKVLSSIMDAQKQVLDSLS